MKISVIIPVYKVEPYIERCARSLFEQTLSDVEYIFVDDATPDNSIRILNEVVRQYPERKNSVIILRQTTNKGLPAARNRGMQAATGDYIFHCDSDDYVASSALEELLAAALRNDADYVWCDWYLTFTSRKRYMQQPSYRTADEALRSILAGNMKYNVWNKLVKRSLYTDNGILFPEGYGMGEDMVMIRLLAYAGQVAHVPSALYYYVKREGEAFTNSWNDVHIAAIRYNTQSTVDFLKQHFASSLDVELAWFKLNVKLPFLISDNKYLYNLWTEFYPEANEYVWSNKQISWHIRLLQVLAVKHCFCLVRMYYTVVYKFVYGVILK